MCMNVYSVNIKTALYHSWKNTNNKQTNCSILKKINTFGSLSHVRTTPFTNTSHGRQFPEVNRVVGARDNCCGYYKTESVGKCYNDMFCVVGSYPMNY